VVDQELVLRHFSRDLSWQEAPCFSVQFRRDTTKVVTTGRFQEAPYTHVSMVRLLLHSFGARWRVKEMASQKHTHRLTSSNQETGLKNIGRTIPRISASIALALLALLTIVTSTVSCWMTIN
jgi:hypothetical protein